VLISNRVFIDVCNNTGLTSMLDRKPSVARRNDMVVDTMKSGMARWCGNNTPRPPLLGWMWAMYLETVGICCMFSRSVKKIVVRLLIPSTRGLDQACQLFGSKSNGILCMMSAPSRCGSFCIVHVLKSLSRVWRSVMSVDSLVYCRCVCSNCSRKKLFANDVDPTGVPSKRKPSVNSMPIVEFPDFSVEYVLIEYSISVVSDGFVVLRDGRMLRPVHDVRILDFSGLMKQPRLSPRVLMLSSRNLRSACGTVQLMSSTHAKR
jgi:hypothetical protein